LCACDEFDRLAEHGLPAWTERAELGGRGESNVDLEPIRQQEDAIDARSGQQVPVVDGPKVSIQEVGPAGKRIRHRIEDPEGKVNIRPFVGVTVRVRARRRGRAYCRIRGGEVEQLLPDLVSLNDREHRAPILTVRLTVHW